MGKIIGVDLGKEYARMAYLDNYGYLHEIADNRGEKVISFPAVEEDMSAYAAVFHNIKSIAEEWINETIEEVVLSVWTRDYVQLQKIVDAAAKSGIKIARILGRPAAAALERSYCAATDEQMYMIMLLEDNYIEAAMIEDTDGVVEIYAYTKKTYADNDKLKLSCIDECIEELLKCTEMKRADIKNVHIYVKERNVFWEAKVKEILKTSVSFFYDFQVYAACGAAVQAAKMSGNEAADILLLNDLPYSIGIKTNDEKTVWVIEYNSLIPTKGSWLFPLNTFKKNRNIQIVYGNGNESEKVLRKITIEEGLLSAGKHIEIAMMVDANYDMVVEIKNLTTQKLQKVHLTEYRKTIIPKSKNFEKYTKYLSLVRLTKEDLK